MQIIARNTTYLISFDKFIFFLTIPQKYPQKYIKTILPNLPKSTINEPKIVNQSPEYDTPLKDTIALIVDKLNCNQDLI